MSQVVASLTHVRTTTTTTTNDHHACLTHSRQHYTTCNIHHTRQVVAKDAARELVSTLITSLTMLDVFSVADVEHGFKLVSARMFAETLHTVPHEW